jgi:cation:H+ antiporter
MVSSITFVVSATVLVVAGTRLARDGDSIAAGTGLGGMWVGAILVAAITSLPELSTDISAVRQGEPALAVGDLFGSNMANMAVLAMADLMTRHTRVLTRVAVSQAAVGTLAICLAALATLGLLAPGWTLAGIGWAPAAVGVAYVAGMHYLHRNRSEPLPLPPLEGTAARRELRRAVPRFAIAAVAILVAAPYLASSTAAVADELGISHGFAGIVLLAVTTSLPEAAVTAASVRAGAYDLAVGNLLGSNCFNMAALLPLDAADGGASLLAGAGRELAIGALAGMLLTALAMLGILDRAERRGRLDPTPIAMLGVYAAALLLTYAAHG